jgi:hypothetical protein
MAVNKPVGENFRKGAVKKRKFGRVTALGQAKQGIRGIHGGRKGRREEDSPKDIQGRAAGEAIIMDKDRPISGLSLKSLKTTFNRTAWAAGFPGAPDPAKMTPQRAKKTPKHVDPGHKRRLGSRPRRT